MPSLADSIGQDMSNYTPVSTAVAPPTGSAPSSDQQPGFSSFTRCPLPPIWQSSPDSLRTYYQGSKVPQYRLLNPPLAPAITNNNVTTTIVNSTSSANGNGGSSSPTIIDAETPAGLVNGSNTIFTLSNSPYPSSGLSLYVNGLYQIQGIGGDYTLAGNTITMSTAPSIGYLIRASYRY